MEEIAMMVFMAHVQKMKAFQTEGQGQQRLERRIE
jgi:hypothetical protein